MCITVGICFDPVLAEVINSNSQTKQLERIKDVSVIRAFKSDETKDAYFAALEDSPAAWAELNEEAIKSINKIQPAKKWLI